MPVMDGWSFLEHIENMKLSKNIKVFIISSSTDKCELQKASQFKTVLNNYTKPILNEHLAAIKTELKTWKPLLYAS
jgi:CheY-like chemotaxis protein